MVDLSETGARLATFRVAETTPVVNIVRRSRVRRRRRQARIGAATTVVLAAVVTVAAVAFSGASTPTERVVVGPATTLPTAAAGVPPASTAAGTGTLTIVLDRTTAPADGTPIHGTVIADNQTGRPITVTGACDGWITVGLANANVTFRGGFPFVLCRPDQVPIGISRYPLVVPTTYEACTLQGGPNTPSCANVTPGSPLPPGTYTTKAVLDTLAALATPPPVVVTLTAPTVP